MTVEEFRKKYLLNTIEFTYADGMSFLIVFGKVIFPGNNTITLKNQFYRVFKGIIHEHYKESPRVFLKAFRDNIINIDQLSYFLKQIK